MLHKDYSRRTAEESDYADRFEELPEEEAGQSAARKKPSFLRSQLMLLTQAAVCVLVLGFAFVTKAIGGTFYAEIASWYFDHYNNSVFTGTAQPDTFLHEDVQITETSRLSANHTSQSSNDFLPPLETGTVTSPYGQREYNGTEQFHKGTDIGADKNTEIHAVWNGTVTTAETDRSYGNYIVLHHENGFDTLYAHCEKLLVQKGDIVTAGNVIGLVGETGDADGCHLHFEVQKDGNPLDPAAFLQDTYS